MRNKYKHLLAQKEKYLIPIKEDLLSLDPKLRLFMAEYSLSKGLDHVALKDVQKVIQQNNKYVNPHRIDAIRLRSRIYEFKSENQFYLKNYQDALTYIQKAISDSPKKKSLIYHRAKVYEKIADQFFRKNNLKRALEFVNLAKNEGGYSTRKSSLKLRAQIYFAFSVSESNINSQIKYSELALKDDPYNEDMKAYIYNLYMSFVSELIDKGNLYSAREIFKKATNIDDTHISTYHMFDRNIYKTDNIFLDASIAEIYAINLRYEEAINLLNKHKYDDSYFVNHLHYNLARYYALNNDKYTKNFALDHLTNFFTNDNMRDSYSFYRNKAKDDPSFLSLQNNQTFYKWLNGINRIKLSLKSLENIPKTDIWSDSDSYLQISQNSTLLLSTPKAQDKRDVSWPEDLFHVVFDYDSDEPLYIKLADSDFSYDDLILDGYVRGYYPGNWSITLNEKTNTILRINIGDCRYCSSEYSTFTSLPPKNSFFASLEDPRIRGNSNSLSTIYVPRIFEDYGNVNQSYYFISGITNVSSVFR